MPDRPAAPVPTPMPPYPPFAPKKKRLSTMAKALIIIAASIVALFYLVGFHIQQSTGSRVTFVGGTKVMTDVTDLDLSNRGLTDKDIVQLSRCTKLEELDLSGNSITDLSPLANLTELAFLELSGNDLSDLSPLYGLKKLTFLRIFDCGLSDAELQAVDEALPHCNIITDW